MKNPNNPSRTTTHISDQLALLYWCYDKWLESEDKDDTQFNYLSELLMNFARSNSPDVLLPEEYATFMQISRDLCVAGGMSDDELNS